MTSRPSDGILGMVRVSPDSVSQSHLHHPRTISPDSIPNRPVRETGISPRTPWITVRSTGCSNPYGTDGSYSCSGTTRIRCDAGTWKPTEYNSPTCGYQPPMNCSNPTGIHGGYGCVGTDHSKCLDGTWYTVEYNSPNAEADSPTRHRDVQSRGCLWGCHLPGNNEGPM